MSKSKYTLKTTYFLTEIRMLRRTRSSLVANQLTDLRSFWILSWYLLKYGFSSRSGSLRIEKARNCTGTSPGISVLMPVALTANIPRYKHDICTTAAAIFPSLPSHIYNAPAGSRFYMFVPRKDEVITNEVKYLLFEYISTVNQTQQCRSSYIQHQYQVNTHYVNLLCSLFPHKQTECTDKIKYTKIKWYKFQERSGKINLTLTNAMNLSTSFCFRFYLYRNVVL